MIVILGGGLAGLSTAFHLGKVEHVVLEAEPEPGGLCRTRQVGEFAFDYTGHLLHLRDPHAIALIDRLLPGAFEQIERRAFIRTRGVTLPFPFQANLHGLPAELVAEGILGFVESMHRPVPTSRESSFRDWSLAVFGKGISEAFMFPYNAKLFRRDPADITADWVGWAVPKPTLEEVIRGAFGIVNRGMGYNATFRYPKHGGIGILPEAFARGMSALRCGSRVTEIDITARLVRLESGERIPYEDLVVTIPLPAFLRMARGAEDLASAARTLDWTAVGCLNLGLDRPGIGNGAHWIYFPDRDAPFYRVGFPTNISRAVAPAGTSSLYVEFGLRREEQADPTALEQATLEVLRRDGLVNRSDRIVARDWVRIDPGYVIFDRSRQEAMDRIVPSLAARHVHLIGRYGAWTYAYMERAILDGLETAARLGGKAVKHPDASQG
jgi:protoporphyrinogen oxidase